MDYIEGLNLSIEYIEDNLFQDVDYDKAARIAGMSKSTYQRFFLLIAEYTRSFLEMSKTPSKM